NDLAVGSHTAEHSGAVDLYENLSGAGVFKWRARYKGLGAVNAIEVVDIMEDSNRDLDIVVGVSDGPLSGKAHVWLQNETGFGRPSGTATYPETPASPDYSWNTGGEVLTLEAAQINEDVYPDLFAGTRSSSFYQGDLLLAISGDYNNGVIKLNTGIMGEAAALDLADFNKDGRLDVVAGTRVSFSLGKVVVFYNESQ
ncbi:MAG: hypothetical protein KAT30_16105, partial [Candidatus Krumholzibacteria bacterium]|nr:hypothetical protein [Candidatus Krumholzibacteria bacterium]